MSISPVTPLAESDVRVEQLPRKCPVTRIFCRTFHHLVLMITMIAFLCISLAATWDVVRPCLACGCFDCSAQLNQVCTAWFKWQGRWEFDVWPVLWMGMSVFGVLMLPRGWCPSTHVLNILAHAANILWSLLIVLPLSWRGVQSRCAGDGMTFALTYIGVATGRLCGINMCLLLICVGRSSAWLKKFSSCYTEAITIHRTTGWWCVAHVTIHALAFVVRYWLGGGSEELFHMLLPVKAGGRMNFRGMLNFYGVLSLAGALTLAGFALNRVRRRIYWAFYGVHIVSAGAFILLGFFHDRNMLWFSLPACSYIVDRAYARFWLRRGSTAQLELLSPNIVKVSVNFASPSSQETLLAGSRWIYVKAACISNEWHPFSITGPTNAPIMHIKTAGKWSRSLCALAETHREIDIVSDGPYGTCPETRFGQSLACEPRLNLLLVAGGVGIVPFADLLDSGELSLYDNVIVIWAVRNEIEYDSLERSLGLQAKSGERVQIHVYITRPTARDAINRIEVGKSAIERGTNHDHTCPLPNFGLALQSRLVTALAPGVLLLVAIKMQGETSKFVSVRTWQYGVFSWSVATHGSELMLVCLALVMVSCCLAFLVYSFWGATRCSSSLSRLLCRFRNDHSRTPLQHQQQVMPVTFCHQSWIKEGRPDIKNIVAENAKDGMTLSLHACGPSPLIESVRVAVSNTRASGKKVTLTIEQSEW